ncbi:MAG: ABC transporter ATP-binding protein [Candidatus Kariarchaeaceae archaeon]|jgi:ABC-type multidrug transport system fused ATPase/permease subunit
MGFVMHGLDKDEYDREYGDWVLLKRILSYFSPYKKHLSIMSITISITAIAAALVPLYMAKVLDGLKEGVDYTEIQFLLILVLSFSVINFVLNAVSQEITARAVQGAVYDLREDGFDALLKRDMSFFDEQPTGRLASRVTNDTNDYGQVVTLSANLLAQVLVVVFILYLLAIRSVKLTILVVIFAPLVILTALSFRKIARDVSRGSRRILAKVNALIQETTSGIYIAKSFRAELAIYDEFEDMNKTSYSINLKQGLVFNTIFPVLNILIGFGTAMVVYFGGIDILQAETTLGGFVDFLPGKQLSIGDWFLFLQGLSLFFFPLISIASFWSQFQLGLAASERVFSMIDAENQVIQTDNKILTNPQGEIQFNNLNFSYKDDIKVLEDFNLHIKPGENIAIVGHTGAGKSTLAKLIARYYEYQSGELRIDNEDIRNLDIVEFRKGLSIISQEVFLFNGSIKDNLLYGIEDQVDGEERLREVLNKIEAMDWIERLDKGIDTNVGERGGLLSMGQRQLIAFARILLRNPFILIMDEATSSVDPFTEVKIQNAINLILEGRTSIIIAHRLSTIKNVDRIIVMKEGKIIEEGSHNELIDAQGHYAELYDTYFRHQSLEYIESIAD